MAHNPFIAGQTYRRRDLHKRYGGQQQGGISTPTQHPFVFLITGDSGSQYGYKDGWTGDGKIFRYTGEGQEGDMHFTRGNKAIRDHEDDGKALHLFEQTAKGFLTYVGEMVCAEPTYLDGPDRNGRQRRVIVFNLRPIETAPTPASKKPDIGREGTSPGRRERAYWAFLANPGIYRIHDAIESETSDYWTVKHHNVRRGDRAVIWKAKGADENRGVVAFAEVTSDPGTMDDPTDRKNYWVDGKSHGPTRRVRIEYVLPPAVPLWLSTDDATVLSELTVTRATGGGVFKIEPDQWRRLLVVAGGWPHERRNEDAILAAAEEGNRSGRKQGFSADPETRRVVEEYAMSRARKYFEARQFAVETHGKPFDLCCRKGEEALFIEVKGTQTSGEEILLTPNEVTFATRHQNRMALFVVHDVIVSREDGKPVASGGTERIENPWLLDATRLSPLGFSYVLEP